MDVRFEYEYEGGSLFGKVYRPIAGVFVQSPKKLDWLEVIMIVDTGADFSILPNHFAQDLQISLERDCIRDATSGVGGNQSIYLLKDKINARLGNTVERHIPLAFFDNDEVPALLGRLGFLETFDVEFLKSHSVVFKS